MGTILGPTLLSREVFKTEDSTSVTRHLRLWTLRSSSPGTPRKSWSGLDHRGGKEGLGYGV